MHTNRADAADAAPEVNGRKRAHRGQDQLSLLRSLCCNSSESMGSAWMICRPRSAGLQPAAVSNDDLSRHDGSALVFRLCCGLQTRAPCGCGSTALPSCGRAGLQVRPRFPQTSAAMFAARAPADSNVSETGLMDCACFRSPNQVVAGTRSPGFADSFIPTVISTTTTARPRKH